MEAIRRRLKAVSWLLIFLMLMIAGPFHAAHAALIATETFIDGARGREARTYLKQLLAREAVRNALVAQGIDPVEAGARIDSLSDAEATTPAERFSQLPAGRGFFETLLIVLFLVFLILLLTDIGGYTDVFPFAKSK
jgi:hypothetical protein